MSLPAYAIARLTRLQYVRFALDHQYQTARVLNTGPQEAAHSSANGRWVHAQIEPFTALHEVEDVAGCTLRLMGHPFRGEAVYAIVGASKVCECGCGQIAPMVTHTSRTRGRIKGQPSRFANGHSPRRRPRASLYTVQAETGCWNWNGPVSKAGYALGTLSAGALGQAIAHRVFYMEARGPIPDGLVLDHLCSNRRCVNPDHLEPVTQRENISRSKRCQTSRSVDV